jgi:hypothetical protein
MNIYIPNRQVLSPQIIFKLSPNCDSKQFQDILLSRIKPDINAIKKRFVIGNIYSFNHTLTDVYTEKLDDLLKLDSDFYVGRGGENGITYKYRNFIKYLETNKPIFAPVLSLSHNSVGLLDGRHTFAVLRDIGMKEIPLAIEYNNIFLARRLSLIK